MQLKQTLILGLLVIILAAAISVPVYLLTGNSQGGTATSATNYDPGKDNVQVKASVTTLKAGETVTLTAVHNGGSTYSYTLSMNNAELATLTNSGNLSKSKTSDLFQYVSSGSSGDGIKIVLKGLKAGTAKINVSAYFEKDLGSGEQHAYMWTTTSSDAITLTITE